MSADRGQTGSQPLLRLLVALAVVALIAVPIVQGATGGTQPAITIDDFEDGETISPATLWTHNDPDDTFSLTSNALNGSSSGVYEAEIGSGAQPVEWVRDSPTSQNASLTINVEGDDFAQTNHSLTWYNGSDKLLEIVYQENTTDSDPGDIVVKGQGSTKVNTWDESGDLQTLTVELISNQFATVYINGTDEGSFNLANASDSWDRFEITADVSSSQTAADSAVRIDDLGRQFTATDPTVDNASASPEGNLSQRDKTLSLDVKDPDFAGPGDKLNVEWFVDGSQIGSDTVTSNGTVTEDYQFSTAGDHTWSATVTDAYGGTTVSEEFNVTVPATLRLLSESNGTRVLSDINATLIFYFDDQPTRIEERTTDDGTLNLTGLPADRPFVVAVESDEYYTRRVYVRSLYNRQNVYLLNKTIEARQPTFVLRDFTGQFDGEDTVLLIQRAINESWESVEGDFFGADGEMSATLRFNARHRFVLINTETGEERIFNAFFPSDNGDKILTINRGETEIRTANKSVQVLPDVDTVSEGNVTIEGIFNAGAGNRYDTASLVVYVENASGLTFVKASGASSTDSARLSVTLNTSRYLPDANGTIRVEASHKLESEAFSDVSVRDYGVRKTYQEDGLLDVLASVPGRIAGGEGPLGLLSVLFATLLGVAAGRQYPLSTELIGLVVVIGIGAFWLIGWAPSTLFAATGIVWTTAAAIRRGL